MTYYEKRLDCPSNSTLKHFRVSPYAYWYHVTQEDRRDTPSMSLGRIIHLALLEPEVFRSSVLCIPSMPLTGKAAKADFVRHVLNTAEVVADIDPDQPAERLRAAVSEALTAAGKTLVTSDQMATLRAQVASLNLPQHRLARQAIAMHELTEVEVYWTDEASGVTCKAKIDQLSRVHLSAADLKSCQSATVEAFRRSLWTYGYHYQEAMYRRACRSLGIHLSIRDFAFILCETSAPYHWNVVHCSPDDIYIADQTISRDLLRLRECLDSDRWPGLIGEEPEVVPMKKAWVE